MKKLLVGYDGSPAAKAAAAAAKDRARLFGARVHLLQCIAARPDEKVGALEAAEKDLETARQRIAADGVPVEIHLHLLVSGTAPGEDLVRFGKKIGADEIVLGVQKKSKLNKLFFGSTIQYVVLQAHCPVVTVV